MALPHCSCSSPVHGRFGHEAAKRTAAAPFPLFFNRCSWGGLARAKHRSKPLHRPPASGRQMMLHRYLAAGVIAVSSFLGCLSSAAAVDFLAEAERLTATGALRAAEI